MRTIPGAPSNWGKRVQRCQRKQCATATCREGGNQRGQSVEITGVQQWSFSAEDGVERVEDEPGEQPVRRRVERSRCVHPTNSRKPNRGIRAIPRKAGRVKA